MQPSTDRRAAPASDSSAVAPWRPPGRTVVVGAGVSGLAAALALAEAGGDVVVLERDVRAGGLVETERLPGGLVFEHGPDGLLDAGSEGSAVVHRLGLAVERPRRRRALLFTERGFSPLPDGLFAFTPGAAVRLVAGDLLDWRGRARMLLEPLVARGTAEDESVAAFFGRRAGVALAERIVAPLMQGVYGAAPSRLGMASAMPGLLALERRYGSIGRAMIARRSPAPRALVTLRDGMDALPRAIVDRLGDRLRTGVAVERVVRRGLGFAVACGPAGTLEADAVILATPPACAARLVEHLDADLAASLAGVEATDVEAVTLAWPRTAVPTLEAAGFLVAPGSGNPIRACTFASEKWSGRAPADVCVVRCVLEPTGAPADEIAETARRALAAMLGIARPPLAVRVRRRRAALPVHVVGHRRFAAEVAARARALGRLALAGNAWRGLGVPDCLASGIDAARLVAS